MKKKHTAAMILSVAVLASISGVIYAYLAAPEAALVNQTTVGYNDMSIVENDKAGFAQEETNADGAVKKEVKITNTGKIPCYVRARIDFSSSEFQAAAKLNCVDSAAGVEIKDKTFAEFQAAARTDWVYNPGDGYFYYTAAVAPDASTSLLLSSFSSDIDSLYPGEHDIIIYSETVQTTTSKGIDEGYARAWEEYLGYGLS